MFEGKGEAFQRKFLSEPIDSNELLQSTGEVGVRNVT